MQAHCTAHILIGQNDESVVLLASEILMNAGRVHTVYIAHVLIGQNDWSVFLLASESFTNLGTVPSSRSYRSKILGCIPIG